MKNKTLKTTIDVISYLVANLLILFVIQLVAQIIHGDEKMSGNWLAGITLVSNLLTIMLFAWQKWSPFSRGYIQSRPWDCLFWVIVFAIGTMVPSELLDEFCGFSIPEQQKQSIIDIMSTQWGFIAIALIVPIAEEMVFRGAILRSLLHLFGKRKRWFAIALSAVIFGAAHGNVPQFLHATLAGLVLGWFYWRTQSIVPGITFHIVNNLIAVIVFKMLPGSTDMKLTEFFQGDNLRLCLYVFFSFCVLVPAWVQLYFRLRQPNALQEKG